MLRSPTLLHSRARPSNLSASRPYSDLLAALSTATFLIKPPPAKLNVCFFSPLLRQAASSS